LVGWGKVLSNQPTNKTATLNGEAEEKLKLKLQENNTKQNKQTTEQT